jgi:CelD/BcsL family acetyltransferase involved in cellulose biosynthesis
MAIEITVIDSVEDIDQWKTQWLALFKAEANSDLSCSYHWLANDFKYLNKNSTRYCYVAHEGNELLGAMVVELDKIKVARFFSAPTINTGSHFVNDFAFVGDRADEVISAIISAIQKNHKHCVWIQFDRLTKGCFQALSQWSMSCSNNVLSLNSDNAAVFDVSSGDYEKFIGRLSTKVRKNFSYYERLIEREVGPLSHQIVKPKNLEESAVLFEQFLTIEKTGWKGDKGSAISQVEESKLFHQAMCETATNEQQMVWQVLKAGEQVIAMNMVLRRGAIQWVPKTAFNDSFRRYSPGAMALTALLKVAVEDEELIEVRMITCMEWVKKWKPRIDTYHGVRIFFPSLMSRLFLFITKILKKEWRLIRHSQ